MRHATLTTTRRSVLGAALLIAAFSPICTGQVRSSLPGSIVEAVSIGSSEQSQISDYVDGLVADATGDDAAAANKARAQLAAPLNSNNASVAFRQAYAAATASVTSSLLASDDTGAVLTGLRISGNTATAGSIPVIRDHMAHSDAGVRIFAAVQARRVFEISGSAGAAITPAQARTLISSVQDAGSTSGDSNFVAAAIRALAAGATQSPRELVDARSLSLVAMSDLVSERVRASGSSDITDEADSILIAATAATRAVSDAGNSVSDDAAKASVGLGANILGMVLRRESAGAIRGDKQPELRLLQAGESLIYFARRSLGDNRVPPTELGKQLEEGDRRFRQNLVALIGPGSGVVQATGVSDDHFVQIP